MQIVFFVDSGRRFTPQVTGFSGQWLVIMPLSVGYR